MALQTTSDNVEVGARQYKKGPIGSWLSRKFGRPAAQNPTEPSAIGKRPVRPSNTREGSGSKYESSDTASRRQPLRVTSSDAEPRQAGAVSSPPLQLNGKPSHDFPSVAALSGQHSKGNSQQSQTHTFPEDTEYQKPSALSKDEVLAPGTAAPTPRSPSLNSNNYAERLSSSEDGSHGGDDSIGNRTVDTGKSRASTKQTTLMSIDTREPTVLPTTHIAQARQTDDSRGPSLRLGSSAQRDNPSALQFAPSGTSRFLLANSQPVEGLGQHVTVPVHSRHHPMNNPHPSGIPPDNASILTLASSTAGMSFAGGPASSRGHNHASSVGGARSIGGSIMGDRGSVIGDRRNSSDTYASLKALPPLSRRGSDSSSRTRESVAASATGQNSHQAMFNPSIHTGPGAPSDRFSLHRTPSQKTVATQLSVPLSTSASNAALQSYTKDESAANGSQVQLANGSSAEPMKGHSTQINGQDGPETLAAA